MQGRHSYMVFYRDYEHDVSIPSHKAESLLAERVVPLAERLLQYPDNYLGIQDSNDIILQCYLDEDEQHLIMELMYPDSPRCLRLKTRIHDGFDLLATLPTVFDTDTLPGAELIDDTAN